MTLQFQPPNVKREQTPTEALTGTLGQAIQTLPQLYFQAKQLRSQHDLEQLKSALEYAKTHAELKKILAETGTGAPAPTSPVETSQVDMGGPGSTIQPGALSLGPTSQPPIENPLMTAGPSAGPMAFPSPAEPTNKQTITTGGEPLPETPEQKLARIGTIGVEGLKKTSGEDGKTNVPESEFFANPGKYLHTPGLNVVKNGSQDKEDQFNQKEFDKIIQDNNPNNASSRTAMGLIGRANLNADRAIATLSKPIVTKQEAGNAMADIASIYQGGAPSQFGMSHQEYNTVYGRVQNAVQSITGNPQDALPDPIKQRLLSTLNDMKSVNKQVVKKNLDLTEVSKRKAISQFPSEWKAFRQQIEGDLGGGTPPPGGDIHSQAIDWANAHPEDPRSPAILQKAKSALGTK